MIILPTNCRVRQGEFLNNDSPATPSTVLYFKAHLILIPPAIPSLCSPAMTKARLQYPKTELLTLAKEVFFGNTLPLSALTRWQRGRTLPLTNA